MKSIVLCCLVFSVLVASVYSEEEPCKRGDTKRVDCNSCVCDDGSWACTEKACISRVKRDTTSCTPGERFKMDCNYCICGRDGKLASCTMMACPNQASSFRQ